MHEQIFRSGGQSDTKPPVLSFQASLVLIYRPTEEMKAESTLLTPGFEPRTCAQPSATNARENRHVAGSALQNHKALSQHDMYSDGHCEDVWSSMDSKSL
ncbi:hypothetical protein TNCV_3561111 [Trichonephila clavipes]|nr:hypothetical protein TNCV_3561111 [Trichonephila clavipes]